MRQFLKTYPLHQHITSSQEGSWLALPGASWRLQAFPSRLNFLWLAGSESAAARECTVNIRNLGPWVESYLAELDLLNGRIQLQIHGQDSNGHCFFVRWSIRCSDSGQPILELSKIKAKCSNVELEVNGELHSISAKQALAIGESSSLTSRVEVGPRVELWFGSNHKLEWSNLMQEKEPWALAHQWLRCLRWLRPQNCQPLKFTLNRYLEEASSGLWYVRWWQLVRGHCLGPMAVFPGDPKGFGWPNSNEIFEPEDFICTMAHLFLEKWFQWDPMHTQLRLQANAEGRVPSGMLGYEMDGIKFQWLWRASRSRTIYLYSTQAKRLQLSLEPFPKRLRLTKSESGASEILELNSCSKVLDLELPASAHYRLDCLEY